MKNPEAQRVLRPYLVWVLAPHLETADPNLSHYYDFTQSIKEYTEVFKELGVPWKWQPVTMSDFKSIIAGIKENTTGKVPLVLNLCDGDEINGTPGISVIRELERNELIYTGADRPFYDITTSKIPMKKAFDQSSVATAPWRVITAKPGSTRGICRRVGTPLIIKPAVSGGSMGVSIKNVVRSEEELAERVAEINKGYRGWNLLADGLFVEKFITGPEFTTFITGSFDDPMHLQVYEPVERIFHPSLPESERFLSFDRLWEIYEDETPMPANENFYEYRKAAAELIPELKKLTLNAFVSCGGKGYARLDIRMDQLTGKLYMLEVNAQCGLSEDEDYTSIGAILKASGKRFSEIIYEILKDALRRSMKESLSRKKSVKAPATKKHPVR
jgi:D-alanine-D-alanine ligase